MMYLLVKFIFILEDLKMEKFDGMSFSTRAIKAGQGPDPVTGALNTPIYETTTYAFPTAQEFLQRGLINACYEFTPGDYLYSRSTNPTTEALENKIASLEGAEKCYVAASGMGAISSTLFALLKAGDHVISSNDLFFCTNNMMDEVLPEKGIETDKIDILDLELIKKTIKPNTKVIYFEVLSNPMLHLADIKAISEIAHEKGILVVADNTFLSPYLLRPLELGADIVVHSGTKYVVGHGDALCGLVSGSKELLTKIRIMGDNLGTHPSPFSSWLALRGARTLPIRLDRISKNALEMAKYFQTKEEVESVIYPGLENHPQYEFVKNSLPNGFGGMVMFKVKGGKEMMEKFINNVGLMPIATSLGDVETLISPKYYNDFYIRMSTGCEDTKDLIDAFEAAFAKL